jgi:hypothetical protein
MQPEGKLDNVADTVRCHALAALILEGFRVSACGQKPLLQVINTDHAEVLGGNRLAVTLHRREQLGDTAAIDLLDTEKLRERLMRAANFFKHLALNGGAG